MRPRFLAAVDRARRWFRPVRNRLTAVATALVTAALALAAVIMALALHQLLLHTVDVSTSGRATQIAAALHVDGVAGVDSSMLAVSRNVDLIQLVDRNGHVVSSSHRIAGRPLGPTLDAGEQEVVDDATATASGPEYRATRLGVATPDGPMTVEVGAAERPIDWLVVSIMVMCCIVFPIIVIGMAVLTYHFVGRALRPVDDIRKQVDEISGGDLHQRVPVPGSGDEIATLATTMNAMLNRIESARGQQTRFVNDASHELNSPLTTLVGLLDLSSATRQPIDPGTVDDVMMPEARRLQAMVADLLLLARADESGVPVRLAEVDLDEIVSAEITRLDSLGRHTVDARIVAARVRGDAAQLARALRNISDNAARHTRDRLTFAMSVDDTRHTATVTVADNGPGISAADRARVLERFVRLDTSRADRGGSGLGLAIVDEIVRAHHGTVVVEDAPDGGARVGFTLPTVT